MAIVCVLILLVVSWSGEQHVIADGLEDLQNTTQDPCEMSPSASSCVTTRAQPPPKVPKATLAGNTKRGAPGDPDKYGLVPPFLIGASIVIIVYIVAHCLYLHCYAKKKMRHMAESNTSHTTYVVNDGPSNASLAVRYDGAYGRTELINTAHYLVCQKGPVDTSVVSSDSEASGTSKPHQSTPKESRSRILAMFRKGPKKEPHRWSVGSGDSVGALPRVEMEPAAGPPARDASRTSLCFVPVGKPVPEQKSNALNSEWTPVQGFMYSQGASFDTNGGQTLVFVPVNPAGGVNGQYRAMTVTKDGQPFNPLEGNASNMAIPLIVEDQASDTGSRESSVIEHEVLVHDNDHPKSPSVPRAMEYSV